MNKKIGNLEFRVLLILIPVALLAYGMLMTKNVLADYVYKTYTEPFLQNGELVIKPHNQKLTTKPLQIEYTVLKVPVGKTTVAEK